FIAPRRHGSAPTPVAPCITARGECPEPEDRIVGTTIGRPERQRSWSSVFHGPRGGGILVSFGRFSGLRIRFRRGCTGPFGLPVAQRIEFGSQPVLFVVRERHFGTRRRRRLRVRIFGRRLGTRRCIGRQPPGRV